MSDVDFEMLFSKEPVKSRVLQTESRVIFLKSNHRIFGLICFRQDLNRALYALFRLGRFAQSKLDNLKKHFV